MGAQIHDEWKRNVLKNRLDLTVEQLNRTSALMDKAIPDALVTDHEMLCSGLDLPDPDDRHVLAAAIRCNAQTIVTFNLKDFPPVQRQRRLLKKPSMSAEQYLEMMLRQGWPRTVKALGTYASVL